MADIKDEGGSIVSVTLTVRRIGGFVIVKKCVLVFLNGTAPTDRPY